MTIEEIKAACREASEYRPDDTCAFCAHERKDHTPSCSQDCDRLGCMCPKFSESRSPKERAFAQALLTAIEALEKVTKNKVGYGHFGAGTTTMLAQEAINALRSIEENFKC